MQRRQPLTPEEERRIINTILREAGHKDVNINVTHSEPHTTAAEQFNAAYKAARSIAWSLLIFGAIIYLLTKI